LFAAHVVAVDGIRQSDLPHCFLLDELATNRQTFLHHLRSHQLSIQIALYSPVEAVDPLDRSCIPSSAGCSSNIFLADLLEPKGI